LLAEVAECRLNLDFYVQSSTADFGNGYRQWIPAMDMDTGNGYRAAVIVEALVNRR